MNTKTPMKISSRLALLVGMLCLLLLAVGGLGLNGIVSTEGHLRTVFDDRLVPVEQLGRIHVKMLENQLTITEALRDGSPERMFAAVAVVEANRGAINQVWAEYMATKLTVQEASDAKAFQSAREQYLAQGLVPVVEAMRSKDAERAQQVVISQLKPHFASVEKRLDTLTALQLTVAQEEMASAHATYETVRAMIIGATLLALAMSTLYGLWLSRSISRQLGAEPAQVSEAVNRVADGDLSFPVPLRAADTSSTMAAVARMQQALSGVVGSVRGNAESVATASAEIAQGNQDLSQRTEEQASALQQTAATMDQLSATIRNNADSARQASQLALGASGVAGKGGVVVGRVVETMKGINDSSKKIADIISVIDGIAFQTNILALNAAVEAARAGDQGRGFAVVASEVRSLAQRSAAAAKEIKTLITDSVEQVEQGSVLVDQAGTTMGEIVGAIQRVADIVAEISAASAEQSAGVGQVSHAVSQMDQVTQQNAALVEEGAAAAESLRQQAGQLVQAVAVFTIAAGEPGRAETGDHGPRPTVKTPGYTGPERRGPDRARNVVRPAFGAKTAAAATRPQKTGTDDWESF